MLTVMEAWTPSSSVCVCVVVNADSLTFSNHPINIVYIVKADS